MVFIYALKLANNKYYIGKTEDPQFRLETHFSQNGGSAWTKKHKPFQIHEIIPNQSDYDEQRVTQEYMNKYFVPPKDNPNAEIHSLADLEYGIQTT